MAETKPADASHPAGVGGDAEVAKEAGETTGRDPAKERAAARGQSSWAATLQDLTDKTLYFLSHASNETLGASLVGLSAATYIALGRVGLVIIGVAGGVVLHATWEGIRSDTRDEHTKKAEHEKRREAGVEVANRLLDWRSSHQVSDGKPEDAKVYANQDLDFSSLSPETATALNTFTDAVIRDYVHYWYDPTIPGEQSFPAACRRTLVAFILSLAGHLRRKRPADVFLDFMTNASSIMIVFLNELSAALNASPNASPEDAISTYLKLKPESSLSYILDQGSQEAKLADAAEDILQAYLDPKAYNCPPVHVFLKEVLARLVLGYTVTYCSAPTYLNEWVVYGLEESETTKEVMDMVDAGMEAPQLEETQPTKVTEKKNEAQEIRGRKEAGASQEMADRSVSEQKRQVSRAEEAMDEAMREAKRLTQLMIEEDERKAKEEQERQNGANNLEDVSDATTQGASTPTSSQSDIGHQSEEAPAGSTQQHSAPESPVSTDELPATPTSKPQFTSFDQILPNQQPAAPNDSSERTRREHHQLTLHNASISIFDDSVPGERTSIKAKPSIDYLVQIEPSSSGFSGWMISRKYADFETLHEVLRRISVITGVPQFTEAHSELPKWKTHTKASLRSELERYLADAVRFQPLAESEGMKRFLEKDQGLAKSPSGSSKGFGWPTPDAFGKFGGDMMNVLTKAPKQVGVGVFGGVAGFVGGKRSSNQSQTSLSRTATDNVADGSQAHRAQLSVGQPLAMDGSVGSLPGARQSQESVHSVSQPSFERKGSIATTASGEPKPQSSISSSRFSSDLARSTESMNEVSPASSTRKQPPRQEDEQKPVLPRISDEMYIQSLDGGLEGSFSLPPPPSTMPDDFEAPQSPSGKSTDKVRHASLDGPLSSDIAPPTPPRRPSPPQPKPKSKSNDTLTDRETSVVVELMFAVITELYTLSSAWQIRRTLLAAAKNFLLRPGNPQLTTITNLLQDSLLVPKLSDSGIAEQIYKLRENTLPTEKELEAWARDYPEKTEEQKEELRIKARKLLVQKGMPMALQSVMGAAASGEALGKVFDCLQLPEVGRGLVFGLLLQALRILTH